MSASSGRPSFMQCARNNQPRGNQELSQTSTLIFARADVSAEMLEKGDFFSQPFVNQIGRFTLSLEHDGEIFQPAVWLQLDVWCLIVGGRTQRHDGPFKRRDR